MNDIEIVKRKLNDLSLASLNRNTWEYSRFLNTAEQSELMNMKGLSSFFLFGGYEGAERSVAVFGNEADIGYAYSVPVAFIEVVPLNDKFADNLTHRDFLGAIMSLGINRDMIGDILVRSNSAVIICIDTVAEYIIAELDRIRHTSVKCAIVDSLPDFAVPDFISGEMIVASERIDVLVSNMYNLSRNTSQSLIRGEKVFCDSRVVTSTSLVPKNGQVISVRGYGRFIYEGVLRTTKKNRFVVGVKKYK